MAERQAAPCDEAISDWQASSRASSLPTPRLSPTDVWEYDRKWTTPLPTLLPLDPVTPMLHLPPAMVPLFPGLPVVSAAAEGLCSHDFTLSHGACRL